MIGLAERRPRRRSASSLLPALGRRRCCGRRRRRRARRSSRTPTARAARSASRPSSDLAAGRACAVSRSHRPGDRRRPALARLGIARVVPCGRAGIKVARVARRRGRLYVHARRAAVKLWDACAPDAIVVAPPAGSSPTRRRALRLPRRPGSRKVENGIVAANAALHAEALAAVSAAATSARGQRCAIDAEVVIVGAGIMGLSIAYHLAQNHGVTRRRRRRQELPLRRRERAQRRRRARAVVERGEHPADAGEHPHLPRLRARDEDQRLVPPGRLPLPRRAPRSGRRALEESVALQNECGLATRMLTPQRGAEDRPRARRPTASSRRATTPTTASSSRGRSCGATRRRATKLGVEIATFTDVVGFDTTRRAHRARVRHDRTRGDDPRPTTASSTPPARGAPRSRACSASSCRTSPHRHEICSTEPLKPWLKPLVADLSNGLYFSQSTRGEIVGGISQRATSRRASTRTRSHRVPRALRARARRARARSSASVKVLRQWAGCYDLTPDANPIVGERRRGRGLLPGVRLHGPRLHDGARDGQAHRRSTSPRARSCRMFERWNLRRFKEGKLLSARR